MSTILPPVQNDATYVRPSAHSSPSLPPSKHDSAIERLFGQVVRLGILNALLEHESLSFVALRDLMATTDGNLSMHARKLEDAQIISCTKTFHGRQPRTEYRLTPSGRVAVSSFLASRKP